MKFARKSKEAKIEEGPVGAVDPVQTVPEEPAAPRDAGDVDLEGDGVERVDLGGILVAPAPGLELRLQVEEKTGEVQSVMFAGPEGAMEVRAFAAPRNGDLWSDVRRQLAAETARRGGTATEQDGMFGTELLCLRTVTAPDGSTQQQPQRIAGINGSRWFLRVTYLGRPAVDAAAAEPWEKAVCNLVVRRGDAAMAPGESLPITLPPQARKVE